MSRGTENVALVTKARLVRIAIVDTLDIPLLCLILNKTILPALIIDTCL
jgi:hypothetical protein